ncbi:MAG: hypothetical protein PHE25_00740 [Candidatus Gracilibacteria bacterium]|nr:hypothetical protein [Candidatus Gracilibacteria bacterium]
MFQDEKLIEIKTCKQCNSSFEITDRDLEFYEKVSPSFGGKKYNISSPTLCPDCRQQRRLSFRNERNLYKRKCDSCSLECISMYSQDKKDYKIYCQDCWWNDNWDPLEYGKDFNFEKGFFEQFGNLTKEVPKVCLTNTYKANENSQYVNYIINAKNSYLCFGGGVIENVYYSNFSLRCNDCLDIYSCDNCENCYESSNCRNCYKTFYSANSNNCENCYFLENCEGCSHCIGCKNISNKKYYVFNKQVDKEEFESILSNIYYNLNTTKINNLFQKIPTKNCIIFNSQNCVGNLISDSKDCYNVFNVKETENAKNATDIIIGQDIYDTNYVGLNASKIYEVMNTSINVSNLLFSMILRDNTYNILYSSDIHGCSNCFGCIGLRNKSYCILNKQYTKEEYEILVPKIIEHMMETGEWGEFFPSSISPFGYNETVAQEYFPISRDKALPYLYNWSTYEPPFPHVDKIIPSNKLPKDITKIPDDILNRAIECEITKKPFRIIKQELEFYRKHNIPIPKRHPDQRHLDRMNLRNPRKLFDRKCDKCGKDIKTTYSPDRKEIVYCEECYNTLLLCF